MNLRADVHRIGARIERRHRRESGPPVEHVRPEIGTPLADRRDHTNTGDDDTWPHHHACPDSATYSPTMRTASSTVAISGRRSFGIRMRKHISASTAISTFESESRPRSASYDAVSAIALSGMPVTRAMLCLMLDLIAFASMAPH